MLGGGEVSLREESRMWSADKTVVARKVSLNPVSLYNIHTAQQDIPDEGREDDGSHAAAVEGSVTASPPPRVVPAHSHSDEGSEPEDHGDELNGSDGELVGKLGEACRHKNKICDS